MNILIVLLLIGWVVYRICKHKSKKPDPERFDPLDMVVDKMRKELDEYNRRGR